MEVVEVSYLPSRVDFGELVERAKAKSCATRVFTTTAQQLDVARAKVGAAAVPMEGEPRASKDSDQLYYLERSHLKLLALTPLQARRVNGALGAKEDPGDWLSPRQQELAKEIQRILARDEDALFGLLRPTDLGELAAYEARLRERVLRANK